ncbi:MAG: hypothetical protein ACK5P3_05300, partial [Dolichospermum sp.]
ITIGDRLNVLIKLPSSEIPSIIYFQMGYFVVVLTLILLHKFGFELTEVALEPDFFVFPIILFL